MLEIRKFKKIWQKTSRKVFESWNLGNFWRLNPFGKENLQKFVGRFNKTSSTEMKEAFLWYETFSDKTRPGGSLPTEVDRRKQVIEVISMFQVDRICVALKNGIHFLKDWRVKWCQVSCVLCIFLEKEVNRKHHWEFQVRSWSQIFNKSWAESWEFQVEVFWKLLSLELGARDFRVTLEGFEEKTPTYHQGLTKSGQFHLKQKMIWYCDTYDTWHDSANVVETWFDKFCSETQRVTNLCLFFFVLLLMTEILHQLGCNLGDGVLIWTGTGFQQCEGLFVRQWAL